MQNNLFVISHLPGKLFSLDALDFVENTIDPKLYEVDVNHGVTFNLPGLGMVFKKDGDTWTHFNLLDEEKEKYSELPGLAEALAKHIDDTCTGMIVYDVAWWAMPFNMFQEGFTTFHFEV